jgi:hypothetical protein
VQPTPNRPGSLPRPDLTCYAGRGYEEFGIQPQYAFGHGLSYTTCEYSGLRTRIVAGAEGAGRQVQALVRVRNTGAVAGTETTQVYVGNLPTRQVGTAPRALAGWETVTLQPGETQQVTVDLSAESLSYWDVDREGETPSKASTSTRSPVKNGDSSRTFRRPGPAKSPRCSG